MFVTTQNARRFVIYSSCSNNRDFTLPPAAVQFDNSNRRGKEVLCLYDLKGVIY